MQDENKIPVPEHYDVIPDTSVQETIKGQSYWFPIDYDLLGPNGEETYGFYAQIVFGLDEIKDWSPERLFSTDAQEIERLKQRLQEGGFNLNPETLIKSMLRLRNERDAESAPSVGMH